MENPLLSVNNLWKNKNDFVKMWRAYQNMVGTFLLSTLLLKMSPIKCTYGVL